VFDQCQDKIHAIFLFLSMLELSQQRFMKLLVGEGRNNFIIEWNDNREAELIAEGVDVNEIAAVTAATTDTHEEDAALLN